MQFYMFEGMIKDETWVKENEDQWVLKKKIRKILLKSRTFNENRHNKSYFYVVEASEENLTAGIISEENIDLNKQIGLFLKKLEIELSDLYTEEITFNAARRLLQTASRYSYIDDDDEVLEDFGLERLAGHFGRDLIYGENLIEKTNRSEICDKAEKFLIKETFLPELDRIYVGKKALSAKGHPVHYMIQTDDIDTRKETCRLLLQALYENGRLQNKRYCFLDFLPGRDFSYKTYDQLYKSNAGGAVIVRYLADNNAESDHADCGRETIQTLCDTMKKYGNSVLTVFCLPRECENAKAVFYENLGITSLVELKEDIVSGVRAENYLKMLAKERHIRADEKLLGSIDEGKGYLATELREIFDEWHSRKLKTSVFPQYKNFLSVKTEVVKAAPKGSAYDELQQMIGLSEAKEMICRALDYHKAQKVFADKGMLPDRPSMHMVFTGAPGTAKTSVARLFAGIMRENGFLSKGRLIEVGRGDLVGKYVGWTAPMIQKKFTEAEGSVLFIDEAYSLVDDRNGSFGDEAINTIVQEMENHRSDVIVIFAGYTDKMEAFLQKNPGLRSRIAFHVPFQNYSVAELCDIAALIARKKGLTLEAKARDRLAEVFAVARNQSDFGNGRYVRNVIEKAKMAQASRLLAEKYENITREDIATLRAEDIELPEETKEPARCIGFQA